MSDAMTTGEIEDILSSIRRLVSEDLRPATRTGATTLVSDSEQAADRLVLTPALRVVPPVAVPDSATPVSLTEFEHQAPPLLLTPAAHPAGDAWHEEAEGDTGPAEVPADVADDVTQDADAPATGDAWAMDTADHGGAEAETGPVESPADEVARDGTDREPRQEDRVARIAAATGRTAHPEWEAETGDAPATRLSWIDVAAAADEDPGPAPTFVHRQQAAATQQRPGPDEAALIGTTEDVLDETVLREIVRSVLREELQGHLGERITRNIRKLVRAEVHRAIALRDYE
ncbi:MAG: hypothetical protein KF887_12075 [Paracoccaceae bacterium]|nr:MAG: hypothetical protein KF887_12075 [Paracoccaceae bacterium]